MPGPARARQRPEAELRVSEVGGPPPRVTHHRQALLRVPAHPVTATTVFIKEKPGEWL